MPNAYANIGFTPNVREEQNRFGSAGAYARVLSPDRDDGGELTAREADFLSARDGIYQATVSETGWPYVQFRGGAPGFVKVIDQRTIGYADFRGNQQYISVGNLRHDDRVSIIALDYARRKRLKLWGHAQIVEDRDVIGLLHDGTGLKVERGIVIRVAAFDWNCPQHIPIRLTDAERDNEIAQLRTRIKTLESRLNEAAAVTQEAELRE
jgi:predicted pyridoxine 5'-phosphate oxidase superfamily flavin-nucleotide-binding protein